MSSFFIASAGLVINRTNVNVTFVFTPTAGGALAANKAITLVYPSKFFAASATPTTVGTNHAATRSASA